MSNTDDIFKGLKEILDQHIPPLQRRKESVNSAEYAGTIPAMQGKQKVDGYYFASLVTKPKDIRLYFFPIYTHLKDFPPLSPELQKFLKGKSCFHVKKLDETLAGEISALVKLGVELYQKDNLI